MATVTATLTVVKEGSETQAKFDALKQKLRDRVEVPDDHVDAVTDVSGTEFTLDVTFTLSSA